MAGYTVGMALYTLVVVALYPAFKTSTSLDNLVTSNPTAAALFGVTGRISTSGGWLNANIYANFFPLVLLLLTVGYGAASIAGYGAASIAGQNEEGTLCLITTLPLRRTAIVAQKAGAMAVQAVLLAVAVAVCVMIGRSFELTVTLANVAAISAVTLLMGLDLGILTMAVGALTGKKGTAISVGTTIAATSYLIGSLAPMASWIHPVRYVSLFYWSVGDNQISKGVTLADYAVLAAVGLSALYAATVAFRRLDVH